MLAETKPAVPASVVKNALGRGLVERDEFGKQGGGRLDLAILKPASAGPQSTYRIAKKQPLIVELDLRGSGPSRHRCRAIHLCVANC